MNRLHTRLAATALAVIVAVAGVGCSGAKPSKAEFRAGWAKMLEGEQVGDKAMMDKILDCLVDETYDGLSTDVVQAIAKGDKKATANVTDADQKLMTEASMTCAKKALEG